MASLTDFIWRPWTKKAAAPLDGRSSLTLPAPSSAPSRRESEQEKRRSEGKDLIQEKGWAEGGSLCLLPLMLSGEWRTCSPLITVKMTLCNSPWVCVRLHGLIKAKKKKKKKSSEPQWGYEKKRKIKKAYVLEVIKRDSEEPAVDLIYTER